MAKNEPLSPQEVNDKSPDQIESKKAAGNTLEGEITEAQLLTDQPYLKVTDRQGNWHQLKVVKVTDTEVHLESGQILPKDEASTGRLYKQGFNTRTNN